MISNGGQYLAISLDPIGQISVFVDDVDAAERFYAETLGLRKLYRFGDLLFFACADVRLFIDKDTNRAGKSSIVYFRVPDLQLVMAALVERGVSFIEQPNRIAEMEDHDLWMTFFKDPAGNTLALMQEAPRGYQPA